MSGLADAMTKAIKRRIDNMPAESAADKTRRAEEAQRRLGFGKAADAPKVKPEGEG